MKLQHFVQIVNAKALISIEQFGDGVALNEYAGIEGTAMEQKWLSASSECRNLLQEHLASLVTAVALGGTSTHPHNPTCLPITQVAQTVTYRSPTAQAPAGFTTSMAKQLGCMPFLRPIHFQRRA